MKGASERGAGRKARGSILRWLGSASPLSWSVCTCRVINAEKSEFNEDQAACCQISVRRREPGLEEDQEWLILCSTQVRPRSEFPQVAPKGLLHRLGWKSQAEHVQHVLTASCCLHGPSPPLFTA